MRCLLPMALCIGTPAHALPAADCPPTAQPSTAEQFQAGLRAARDHGFLWRISKGGHSSYLYGTLHVAKQAWVFPGPRTAQALAASDTLALELDLVSPDVQQRLARGMSARSGVALPEPARLRVARLAAAECIPPQALATLGPELQVATLMSVVGRRDGLDPAYAIDMFLSDWGHAARKTVVSLETPELQLRALLIEDAGERLEFVESALDELESGRARPQLLRIAQVWADGALDTLTRYEDWCECMKTPADRDGMARLLDERNPALADGIDALHGSGQRVFAAVGSLHMIGPQGLPALLAQRGYRVERITAGAP
jgi:uncharacterized protein YbaP (TraB family)